MAEVSKTPVSDFDAAVRLLSGGTNVALYNDLGLPSVYVRRDKGLISDVISGGSDTTHYAFKVNGVDVPAFYMGKYLATVYKGRALSLPLQDPASNEVTKANRGTAQTNGVNFDNAKIWCEANGAGFHLPTLAEYAWIWLMCHKNGTKPSGNYDFGAQPSYEKGVVASYDEEGNTNRTLTGSGPASWNDNMRPDGICDIVGNVSELQGGYRTIDGELQIFQDNDAAMQYEQNASSTLWKAILQDGTLVEPGTDGTLKWDYVDGTPSNGTGSYSFRLNTVIVNPVDNETAYGVRAFKDLSAAEGVLIPERLIALGLMPSPIQKNTLPQSNVLMRNLRERIQHCGGSYLSTRDFGLFGARSLNPRTFDSDAVGFRPAFIPGI